MGTEKRARQKELRSTRAEEARKQAASLARRKRMINLALAVGVVGALVAIIVFWAGDSDDTKASDTTSTTAAASSGSTTTPVEEDPVGTAACPAADGSSERMTSFDGRPKMCIDPTKKYSAEVVTNLGSFTLELDAAKAPNTVNNFVFLARYHYYDSLTFHRIIDGFMIQGGDPDGTGSGGPGYQFADELPAAGEYEMYSVAMANAGPNTNGSQFFVITGDQGVSLPPQYSLFGKAVAGTDVVDKIGKVKTGEQDRPVEPVTMTSVTITES